MAAYATQITESVPPGVTARATETLTRDEVMTAGELLTYCACRRRPSTSWPGKACSRRVSSGVRGDSCVLGSRISSPAEVSPA
jgi:hypothetical protein